MSFFNFFNLLVEMEIGREATQVSDVAVMSAGMEQVSIAKADENRVRFFS